MFPRLEVGDGAGPPLADGDPLQSSTSPGKQALGLARFSNYAGRSLPLEIDLTSIGTRERNVETKMTAKSKQ